MNATSGRICHERCQKYAHTFAVEIGEELGFFRLLYNRYRKLGQMRGIEKDREREKKRSYVGDGEHVLGID